MNLERPDSPGKRDTRSDWWRDAEGDSERRRLVELDLWELHSVIPAAATRAVPLEEWIELLRSPHAAYRWWGLEGLSRADRAGEALSDVAALVHDVNLDVRHRAGMLLERVAPGLARAAIAPWLAHSDPRTLTHALTLLGKLRAGESLVPIRRLSHDSRPEVRAAALRALGRLGDRESVPYLTHCLQDAHPAVQCAALLALVELNPAAGLGPELFARVLGLAEPAISELIRGLTSLGDPGVGLLAQLLLVGHRPIRDSIVLELQRTPDAAIGVTHRQLISPLLDPDGPWLRDRVLVTPACRRLADRIGRLTESRASVPIPSGSIGVEAANLPGAGQDAS